MAFFPWMQQAALPPGAEQQAPPQQKKNWWEQGLERMGETGGFTMPWQTEHWENQPDWTRHAGKAGLGVGLTALGALGGMAAPGAMFGLGSRVPWLGGLAKAGMGLAPEAGKLGALGKLGAAGGLFGSAFMAPGGVGAPTAQPSLEEIRQGLPANQPGFAPPAPTAPPGPVNLPTPGPGEAVGPGSPPQVVEVGGQKFWWNPTGGMYGTGGWDTLAATGADPSRLTPEQQMGESAAEREAAMARLKVQYELEQQIMGGQQAASRGQQEAGAAQQMAQMYAADPYKYWAQMGQGTPGAVAQLTGGEVAPGEQFPTGVPLSTPSQQWWGNLLPSEQQQIMGGLNWMGMDPQDWMAMQQRMIPGLGARQMAPVWAR